LNTNNRRTFSTPSRIALSVLAILASAADAQAVTEWDLPGQPLASTLRDIAARTDSNIIFDKKLVRGQSAPPLKTRATTEEALSKVLEGTGLTYRQLDDKTVTIQLASTDPASATSSTVSTDGRIRLAQAQTGPRAPERSDSGLPSVMLLEEIVVTGTNIRGVQNTTVPLIVLDREYIESSGISTTTRLIESLPQNFAVANQSSLPGPNVSDARTQGSAINLRGIGEGTTLVLINGRRTASGFLGSAVDISALPISAIERVEILSDGASALYGSDAVGGVVNFILRSDFEGAETRLRGGSADGADEYSASQMLGNAWDSGNALFGVEYYKRDLLETTERDFVPSGTLLGSLLPEDENYSAMFTGRQDLSSFASVFADALYTRRETFNRSGQILQNETFDTENPQLTATLGVEWRIGESWQIETSGTYADYELEQVQTNSLIPNFPATVENNFTIQAARVKADGTLFSIPGGDVRAAIGADYREEAYESSVTGANGMIQGTPVDIDQDVTSGFAELFIPLVGEGNRLPGIHSFEVSLAARHDDYSNFGSSTDPKYGIAWQPVADVRLRASFGTSYVAPRLLDYNLASTRAFGLMSTDPQGPGGFSSQIQILGTDSASLRPQESDNLSLGLEFTPEALPGFQAALNYYDIEYTDRIAAPPGAAAMLANPAVYANLIIRNPTPAQIAAAIAAGQGGGNAFLALPGYNPNAVLAIVDARRRNLSVTNTSGVDFSTRYGFTDGMNNFSVGLAATYVLDLETQVTTNAPTLDVVDTIGNPPHWRGRASLGWQRGGWATNLFINHTDSYIDNRILTTPVDVDAYTTADLRVSYNFSAIFKEGAFSGVTVALSALNVADEDPPRTRVNVPATDLGFDSTNASPLGRLISIELTKTW
jgi:iron complex outermembrane recepter protein